jgi:NAD dependent epimerase/dehydratase family
MFFSSCVSICVSVQDTFGAWQYGCVALSRRTGDWKIMLVLVVGGAGYIGSHAARTLKRNGYDVVIYDNLSTGHGLGISRRNCRHALPTRHR